MGLYFRKSVRMGPFRVNFSRSGIGLSAGIPGIRIGTGPRGNYIQMGAHGIYYRTALPAGSSSTPPRAVHRTPTRPIVDRELSPPIPSGTLGEYQPIESVDAADLVDSSSEKLLNEIRKKHERARLWPFAAAAGLLYLGVAAANNFPMWSLILGAILAIGAMTFAYRWDVIRKLVVLHYELSDQSPINFTTLIDAASEVAAAARTWHISATANVKDRKYHAGASSTVKRNSASFSRVQPPYIASNLDPVTLKLSKAIFYFFPDRLLVYSEGRVGAVSYETLRAAPTVSRFIEDEAVPRDSKVVDRTWRYVNKGGGPDRRFKDNRQLPICAYGEVYLRSESGVNELLMMSRQGPENRFAEAINHLVYQKAPVTQASAGSGSV